MEPYDNHPNDAPMPPRPDGTDSIRIKPRLIIHGGAGNIQPGRLSPKLRAAYAKSLFDIIHRTNTFMTTPRPDPEPAALLTTTTTTNLPKCKHLPPALETCTYAVALLEDDPLFNAGHGAVFTRDGINELEASVMVSRGHAKRGVGVAGLRRVRNPIRLARAMLEHGDRDVWFFSAGLDVPSAQGHSLISGAAAEQLAESYRLEIVDQAYFFTQRRWDEHVCGLEREKNRSGSASWCRDEFVPQGTVGAVALDEDGVVCAATSTGGLTNKLTGRVGDTPMVGAGFWAEEWEESVRSSESAGLGSLGVGLERSLLEALSQCAPLPPAFPFRTPGSAETQMRALAVSGTGNGDSFIRTSAARTTAALARFGALAGQEAVTSVAGPGGELQRSAGPRWGHTGEGAGGFVGVELVAVRDAAERVVEVRSRVVGDYNCGGMFRAWVDWDGTLRVRIFREDEDVSALSAPTRRGLA